jgi:hypothetical protein
LQPQPTAIINPTTTTALRANITATPIALLLRWPGSVLRVRHDCVRRVQIHKHLQKMGLIIPILDEHFGTSVAIDGDLTVGGANGPGIDGTAPGFAAVFEQ